MYTVIRQVADFHRLLPRGAMHKRGLCQHAVSVRPSVRLCHVRELRQKTNKDIFQTFSPSGIHTILVFPYQTGCRYSDGNPLMGASNAGGVGKKTIPDEYLAVLDMCVLVLTASTA